MEFNSFINYALFFSVGLVLGYFLAFFVEKLRRKAIIDDKVFKLVLSFTVIGIFVVAFLVSVFDRTYEIPLFLQAVVGAVMGDYFGAKYLERKRNERNTEETNDR